MRQIARHLRCILSWLDGWQRHTQPHVYLVCNNANHRRLLSGVEADLRQRGETALLVPSDDITIVLSRARRGDVVAFAADWSPSTVVLAIRLLKWKGVHCVGFQEGVRPGRIGRYENVDTFLAWGDFGAATVNKPTRIVGSPTLEALLETERRPDARPMALINYKSKLKPDANPWLPWVVQACEEAGVTPVISGHGKNATYPRFSGEDFRELIQRAAVLITPISTTVFEACACDVPTIVTFDGEDLMDLARPDDAYDIVRTGEDLADAISRALQPSASRTAARRRFLERHVSIEPDRPANRRIADALLSIANPASAEGKTS